MFRVTLRRAGLRQFSYGSTDLVSISTLPGDAMSALTDTESYCSVYQRRRGELNERRSEPTSDRFAHALT
ncbi:hypothetical protein V2G26_007768 [Clonostachys chloroleuca]